MTLTINDIADVINISVSNPAESGYDVFVGLEHYDIGEPVITRYGSTKMLTTACKKFSAGDILLARRNVYLRRAGIVEFDGLTSGDSIVIRVKTNLSIEGVDSNAISRLLPFILNTNAFWDFANTNSDGTMSKRLSPQMLLSYEFELPPVAQQRPLADKLWAAYKLKASKLKLIEAIDEMVKSQFIEMFKDSPKTKLSDFCELKARIGWQGLKHEEFLDEGDYFLVTGVDFDEHAINWAKCHYVTKDRYDQDPYIQLHNGDVLVTKDGTIGKVALVTCLNMPATLNSGVFVLRDKKNLTLNRFLFYCLLSRDFEQFIEDCKTGSTIAHLNQKAFVNYLIPTPDIKLQQRFVSIAEQADKSKSVCRQAIKRLVS